MTVDEDVAQRSSCTDYRSSLIVRSLLEKRSLIQCSIMHVFGKEINNQVSQEEPVLILYSDVLYRVKNVQDC